MTPFIYKAKQLHGNQWFKGYYLYSYFSNLPAIQLLDTHEHKNIQEDTLSVFTGFYDKNKNEIFENDIVRVKSDLFEVDSIGTVKFIDGCFVFHELNGTLRELSKINELMELQVIGNIFDNPDFVKETTWKYIKNIDGSSMLTEMLEE